MNEMPDKKNAAKIYFLKCRVFVHNEYTMKRKLVYCSRCSLHCAARDAHDKF